jgi:hypothetical protein
MESPSRQAYSCQALTCSMVRLGVISTVSMLRRYAASDGNRKRICSRRSRKIRDHPPTKIIPTAVVIN